MRICNFKMSQVMRKFILEPGWQFSKFYLFFFFFPWSYLWTIVLIWLGFNPCEGCRYILYGLSLKPHVGWPIPWETYGFIPCGLDTLWGLGYTWLLPWREVYNNLEMLATYMIMCLGCKMEGQKKKQKKQNFENCPLETWTTILFG